MVRKRRDTAIKHMYLREFAKNLIVMKECNFDIQTPAHKKCLTRESLLTKIQDDKLFAAIVCDVKVPDNYNYYLFAEISPIFKNTEISIDDVGPYMKNVCEQLDVFKTLRRSLIGSLFGKQIMTTFQLLKWYLESRH